MITIWHCIASSTELLHNLFIIWIFNILHQPPFVNTFSNIFLEACLNHVQRQECSRLIIDTEPHRLSVFARFAAQEES